MFLRFYVRHFLTILFNQRFTARPHPYGINQLNKSNQSGNAQTYRHQHHPGPYQKCTNVRTGIYLAGKICKFKRFEYKNRSKNNENKYPQKINNAPDWIIDVSYDQIHADMSFFE